MNLREKKNLKYVAYGFASFGGGIIGEKYFGTRKT